MPPAHKPYAPLKFSADSRAALVSLAFRFGLYVDWNETDDGDDTACLTPTDDGWALAHAHPSDHNGSVTVTRIGGSLLGTFATDELVAALTAYLSTCDLDSESVELAVLTAQTAAALRLLDLPPGRFEALMMSQGLDPHAELPDWLRM